MLLYPGPSSMATRSESGTRSEIRPGTGARGLDFTKLLTAVGRGDLGTVKDLTQARSTDITQTDANLFTIFAQIACASGHVSILRYLVEDLSVDINSVTTTRANFPKRMPLGSSLLQISIFHDDKLENCEHSVGAKGNAFDCISWLARSSANIDHKNSEGEDAFALARRTKRLQALGCLSCSLLAQLGNHMDIGRFPGFEGRHFDAFQLSHKITCVFFTDRIFHQLLELLGLVWCVKRQKGTSNEAMADLFNTLKPHISESVCEEKSTSDYRWIGEPAYTFSHEGSVSIWILKASKHKSRWADAYDARKKSGIRGTATNAGLEVVPTFDEYCYPDLGEEALKERNGDQVVCKHIQRLHGKLSDDFPMLAISQACVWRLQNGGWRDSIFISIMQPSTSDAHSRESSWYPFLLTNTEENITAEEFIGVVLSEMLVDRDILLQDDHRFDVPRLVTIFARSIARVQQDVNEYVQLSDIRIAKEKSFLHDIEDIREEISMIQTVLIQQEGAWREFAYKSWPHFWKTGYQGHFEPEWKSDWESQDQEVRSHSSVGSEEVEAENKWRVIQRPQEHFRRLRTRLDKLDRDAERVQRSIELKLDLKQRHASLREARTASLMGASVAGFTIITIVFTPLSFMTGLFALPIDRLEVTQSTAPDSFPGGSGSYSTAYIAKWMATTELVALAITIFCVWLALKYFTQGGDGQNQLKGLFNQAERAGGKYEAQSAKGLESTAGSGDASSRQREDISQDAVEETEHVRFKQSVREWAISTLERLLNFLKNGREKITPV